MPMGSTQGSHLLVNAVQANDMTSVLEALDRGVDVNSRQEIGSKQTVLMIACVAGLKRMVNILIQRGANVNLQDTNGVTALIWAAKFGRVDIALLLIENKANVNLQEKYGNTALHWGAALGEDGVVCVLLQFDAKASIVNKEGLTAVQRAEQGTRGRSNKEGCVRAAQVLRENVDNKAKTFSQSSSGKGEEKEGKPTSQAHCGDATGETASQQSDSTLSTATASLKQVASENIVQQEHFRTNSELNEEQPGMSQTDEVEVLRRAVATERRSKETALADNTRMQEQVATLLRDLDKERREKEAAQQESRDRDCENVDLKENLFESGTLLTNAEAALSQVKLKLQDSENVLRIPSNDIRLTDKRLGVGSYGEVYIGYWRGCPVAVKMMHEVLAAAQRSIDLLLQEVGVTWKMHHPNIAAACGLTLELEEPKKKAWIIMELLQGSLSDVIDDSRKTGVQPLTMREKVDMAYDSLCGLDYLHTLSRPVLHGDIRPTNILITPVMRAKLADMGAARFTDATLSAGLVSPDYTATERLDGRAAAKSKETDLYSMGVTVCEIFTGVSAVRADRDDQLHLIDQKIVRVHCINMTSDNPCARPSASRVLAGMDKVRQSDEYTSCPPKRMVRGLLDGLATVTLTQETW